MTESGASPTTPQTAERFAWRTSAARWVLMFGGLLSLATFYLVPFANATTFVRVIAFPAFDVASSTEHPAANRLADAVKLDAIESELMDGGRSTVTLTAGEVFDAGSSMVDVSPDLVSSGTEIRVIGRYLMASMGTFLLCGVVCVLLPLIFGAPSRITIVCAGVSALLLLAGHVMTIGFDASDIADASVFTWQSHVLSSLVVAIVGLGTVMPLRQDTVLVAFFGTLGGFVLGGIGLGVWVIVL